MSALSKKQKAYLAQLAGEAFAKRPAIVGGADDGIDVNAWRQREVGKACGKLGLRCCSQMDYKLVEAHFLRLLGRERRAEAAFVAAATEPRRHAEGQVMAACRLYGFRLGYAESICASIYRCSLSEAETGALRNLTKIIHRNGKRRAGKAQTT